MPPSPTRDGKGFAALLPPRTVTLRGGASPLTFDISPARQLGLMVGALALGAWTMAASAFVAVETVRSLEARAPGGVPAERLADPGAERDRLLAALAAAEARAAGLEAALTARHDLATEAIASERALTLAKQRLKARQAALTAERDALLAGAASMATQLADLETALDFAEADRRDLVDTLHHVARALDVTAGDRDGARAEILEAEGERSDLVAAAEQQRLMQEQLLSEIEAVAAQSVGSLEDLFRSLGVDADRIIGRMRSSAAGTGGPYIPAAAALADLPPQTETLVTGVFDNLERAALLREAALTLPLGQPVSNPRVTSPFGWRRDPFNGRRSMHEGVDFAGPVGTPIYAPADGVVSFSGWMGGYGRVLKIRHENGFETLYAHLNRARVRVGERVRRGQRVADMGNTGRSTGPHLHYEVRLDGRPLDPMKFMRAARHVL